MKKKLEKWYKSRAYRFLALLILFTVVLLCLHSYFRRERQRRPGEDHEVREVPHEPPHPSRQVWKAQIVRHAPAREAVD